jgi:hypothetical protein
LGPSNAPLPFGGRTKELASLSAWLNDPASPARYLIIAPAGCGKTSILTHWIQEVPSDWKLAFVSISLRFETSQPAIVYEALAHQLASIAGQQAGSTAHNPDEFYKDRCIELLAVIADLKIKTLLVLDGLDEASGWEFSNTILASSCSTLRIVVSARILAGDGSGPNDWLARVDWTGGRGRLVRSMSIDPLDRNGISDVLELMGFPVADPASDIDIASELLRLTGGYPLLVRLYAEALWEGGEQTASLCSDELVNLTPGLAGFFDWFKMQEGGWRSGNKEIRDVILAVLATAHGPLLHSNLAQIARLSLADSKIAISSEEIEPIRRFLIGDGGEIGYSFQHPAFADYFKKEHFKDDNPIVNAEAAIRAWCSNVLTDLASGDLQIEKTPSYVLNFYVKHLVEAKSSVESLRQILDRLWQSAWFYQDAGYQRYSSDIVSILVYLSSARHISDVDRLTLGVHGALIISSIRSIGAKTPWQLLVVLVRAGLMSGTQALHRLSFQADSEKEACLPALFDVVDSSVRPTVLEAAEAIGDENKRVYALAILAARLDPERRQSVLASALTTAEAIDNDIGRGHALAAIAERLIPERDAALLIRLLAAVESNRLDLSKYYVLEAIAKRLEPDSDSALVARAFAAAKTIGDEEARAGTLLAFAKRLEPERDAALSASYLAAADAMGDDEAKAFALANIAGRLEPGSRQLVLARALTIAKAAGKDWVKKYVLDSLAQWDAATVADAVADVEDNGDDLTKLLALLKIAEHLEPERDAALVTRALAAADGINNPRSRASVLLAVAKRLDSERRESVVAGVLADAEAIGDGGDKAHVIAAVAKHLEPERDAALLARAFASAEAIGDERARADAVQTVAERLEPARDASLLARALAAVDAIGDGEARAGALVFFAERPDLVWDATLLARALAAAEGIGDNYFKAQALASVAQQLGPERRQTVLIGALTASEHVDDERRKADALLAVAKHLDPERDATLLARALAAAEDLDDKRTRANALLGIAERLDPERDAELVTNTLAAAAEAVGNDERDQADMDMAEHLKLVWRNALVDVALARAEADSDDGMKLMLLSELAMRAGATAIGARPRPCRRRGYWP